MDCIYINIYAQKSKFVAKYYALKAKKIPRVQSWAIKRKIILASESQFSYNTSKLHTAKCVDGEKYAVPLYREEPP